MSRISSLSRHSVNYLRRAMLYVPADRAAMLAKSSGFRVDSIIYDLEDSIQKNQTKTAMLNLKKFLASGGAPSPSAVPEIAIRIPNTNVPSKFIKPFEHFDQWLLAGRESLTFVVPKVESAYDVELVARSVTTTFPKTYHHINLMLLVESARAIMNIREITQASPMVSGLIFGAEDFAEDVGLTRTDSLAEFTYARSAVVTAAKAAGIRTVIDMVTLEHGLTSVDQKKLRREADQGRQLGFTGKQVIHPNQVELTQTIFSPSPNEVKWAVQVVMGWAKSELENKGSFSLDGKMIDRPVVKHAYKIIEKAEACGLPVPKADPVWAKQSDKSNSKRQDSRGTAEKGATKTQVAAVGQLPTAEDLSSEIFVDQALTAETEADNAAVGNTVV